MFGFKKKRKNDEPASDSNGVIGVTMGYSLKPQLCFEGRKVYLKRELDRLFHPEYFVDGKDWPVDPVTKEELPIV